MRREQLIIFKILIELQICAINHRLCSGIDPILHCACPPYMASTQVPNLVLYACCGRTAHGVDWIHQPNTVVPEEPIFGPLLRHPVLLHRCCTRDV